jgi:hypothetical protein
VFGDIGVKSDVYPAEGTYFGAVTQQGQFWVYNLVRGYTYPGYAWPTSYTYSWNTYSTNMVEQVVHYDYVIEVPGDYLVTSLSGKTLVTTSGARLVVNQGISLSNDDVIKIAPNASLEIWSDGVSVDLQGNGIMNESGYAKNFILNCTQRTRNVSIGGNSEFIGVLVATYADLTMSGAGQSNYDFIGSGWLTAPN